MFKNYIFVPVVMCGHEMSFLNLKQEYRLMITQSSALRSMLGVEMDEVMRGWKGVMGNQ
jgi:hypothetical protein